MTHPLSTLDRHEIIKLQRSDPNLSHLFDLVSDEATNTVGYFIQNCVLIRKWRDRRVIADCVDPCVQVVVPRLLRYNFLEIRHSISAAGHLGLRNLSRVCAYISFGQEW